MGVQGTTTITFGAFPGKTDTSVAITGQSGINATSLVEAWLLPAATADHSADEHIVDGPVILAGNIVVGTGFTIYAVAQDSDVSSPDADPLGTQGQEPLYQGHGRTTPMPYGIWNVAWVWN